MAPEEPLKRRQPEYNVYRSRRRAAVASEENPKRRGLVDLIVRAGAVATAIGSIVAVVTLVWPDSKPPAKPRAKLTNLAVETNVTLAEWSLRRRQAMDRAPAPDGLVVVRRASIVIRGASAVRASATLAQDPNQARPEEETPTETAPQDPGPEQQPEETPDQPGEPPAGGEPSTSEQDIGGSSRKTEEDINKDIDEEFSCGGAVPSGVAVPPRVPLASTAELSDGQTPLLGVADEASSCGDAQAPEAGGEPAPGTKEAEVRARALLKLLRGTRNRPSQDGRLEPVGVTVSFDAALKGFSGRRADVRWSLYDAGARKRVPREWLLNRPALKLTAESASDDFWVPLPKLRGPFYVRIGVYDDDRNRLTFADSRRFR